MCDCDSQHCDMMPKKLIGFCITSNTKTKLFFVWVRIYTTKTKYMCVCPNKTNHAMTCSSTTLMTALDFFLLKFFFDFFVTISHGCVTYFLCITTIHTTTTMTPISQRAAAAVCCCCFFLLLLLRIIIEPKLRREKNTRRQ